MSIKIKYYCKGEVLWWEMLFEFVNRRDQETLLQLFKSGLNLDQLSLVTVGEPNKT